MISDRHWRRVPAPVQFLVLLVALPGLVAHEYVHAVSALLEGADSIAFDWGRAGVHIDWENGGSGRWTWIAPSLVGIGVGIQLIISFVWLDWRTSLAVLLWIWFQFLLFAFPSANDIQRFQEAI